MGRPVHYGPGEVALCGEEPAGTCWSYEAESVAGCDDCLELVAEELADDNDYQGRCLHCRQVITATGSVEWRRVVRRPCPHCGKAGW